MKPIDRRVGKRRFDVKCLGLWLAVAAIGAACAASGPFLQMSQQVSEQFEAGAPPAAYRYFTLASGERPYVLLGVLPEFAPPGGDHWQPVSGDSAVFLELVRGMQFFDEQALGPDICGAKLMLPGGRQIGVWYSSRGRGTAALGADNRLSVWPPKQVRQQLIFRKHD